MDKQVLDALDNYRLRMVKEGVELLSDMDNNEAKKVVRQHLNDMAHKINGVGQRRTAFRLLKGE